MDTDVLTPEQKQKIKDIANDFYRYCKNNLYIKNKAGKIVPLEPNSAQKALVDRVLELIELDEPIRIIVLKARQMGLSTIIEALIFWWVTTHSNMSAMIVAHEQAASENLYKMFKRYYDNANPIFKPTRKYNTRKDLVFDTDDSVGLGSVIKTASAENISVGRSDTIQLLHGSEVGEWKDGESLVASLLQTVPILPETFIFLESTAKGIGNYFHKEWENAKKGDSVFEPFFFPWWQHKEYEMDGKPIDKYTPEEEDILELFEEAGIPKDRWDAKIRFRRYKEKEFQADPKLLYQEYPSTDLEAFLASGRPVFDIKALVEMQKHTQTVEDRYYEIKETEAREVSVEEVDESPLKIWKQPEEGSDYVIGADVAEGLAHGDWSVAEVMDSETMETVARWRGHIDPDLFGDVIDQLGRYYNYALVGVEVNNHGLTTIQRLRDKFYSNLYRRERGQDERFEEMTSKLGWKTDIKTKRLMIDYLAQAIREKVFDEPDIVFVREAMSYVRDDSGRTNAQEGAFDDTVMAKAIALQMFEWSTNNKKDLQVQAPEDVLRRKRQHKMLR